MVSRFTWTRIRMWYAFEAHAYTRASSLPGPELVVSILRRVRRPLLDFASMWYRPQSFR